MAIILEVQFHDVQDCNASFNMNTELDICPCGARHEHKLVAHVIQEDSTVTKGSSKTGLNHTWGYSSSTYSYLFISAICPYSSTK